MTVTARLITVGGALAGLFLAVAATNQVQSADEDKPAADEKTARTKSAKNLRQLAIAMHNYADRARGQLPPVALKDKSGKPLLSWRVALLPFLEEDKLYKEFRLEEPWDSAHNKKLLAKMPKLYAPVIGKSEQPHSTYYQVFTGDGAWGGNGMPRLPDSFLDSTTQTIMIIEAGEPVPWTKPLDLHCQAKKALPKLGGLFKEGYHVAMGDASVFFIKRKKITEKTLRAAITRNGRDKLGEDWFEAREE